MSTSRVRASRVFTVSFPEDLAVQVEEVARQESRNISELFREAFRSYKNERIERKLSLARKSASQVAGAELDVERLVDELRSGTQEVDGINLNEFSEPISIEKLRFTRYASIPKDHGVYLVLRRANKKPSFLDVSPGGWFQDKDPSYSKDKVRANWVESAQVLYVGMSNAQDGLRGRIRQYLDFGNGKNIGHRGGRMLWHLKEPDDLLVRWKICANASAVETNIIKHFKAMHGGRRPFANMMK